MCNLKLAQYTCDWCNARNQEQLYTYFDFSGSGTGVEEIICKSCFDIAKQEQQELDEEEAYFNEQALFEYHEELAMDLADQHVDRLSDMLGDSDNGISLVDYLTNEYFKWWFFPAKGI